MCLIVSFVVCLEETSAVPVEAETLSAKGTTPSTTSFQPDKAYRGDVAALQPVMGISQRVHTGPKKKKDLGTTGMLCSFLFFIFGSLTTYVIPVLYKKTTLQFE